MKKSTALTFAVLSLVVVTGCRSSHERHARYDPTISTYGYTTPSTTTYSATPSTTTSSTTTTPSTSSQTTIQQTFNQGDTTLATQIKEQLRADNDNTIAAVAPNIQVNVQGGKVTLTGNVNSEQQKQQIESKVQQMSGVVSVQNQIQVSAGAASATSVQPSVATTPAQTDAEQKDASTTETTTAQGTEQSRALTPTSERPEASSRIYSTTTNEVKKSTDTSQPADISQPGVTPESQGLTEADRALASQVMQSLRSDATFGAFVSGIKVSADNGKLTLRGTVSSDQQKRDIEAAVRKITGVASVDNQLEIQSTTLTP